MIFLALIFKIAKSFIRKLFFVADKLLLFIISEFKTIEVDNTRYQWSRSIWLLALIESLEIEQHGAAIQSALRFSLEPVHAYSSTHKNQSQLRMYVLIL